jgi:cellulose synthase/poly-beta-1,6-N-acetylglucosamine synthase-like glycosyltransferase
MAKPLVSFVIPVFNSERDIARCLLSIRHLHFPEEAYEVLIMDNGSTDQTHEIMRHLGFPFRVIPKVNVSTLRNRGADIAQGDYVAFVDSDVELTPDWLQNGLATLTEPRVVACGCFPGVPQEATWVQQTWDMHQRGRQVEDKPTPVPWLASMNLIVRREAFLAISGFNEELETAEDVDLCYRLSQHGIILSNRAMEATHWGEARDVRTFWRKEVWRGLGNMQGVLSHGLRWDELPSLGYPLYVICLGLLFILGCIIDLWYHHIRFAPLGLVLLTLPALLLACRTAYLAHYVRAIPQLFLLYFVYGLARAYAVIKSWIPDRHK